MAQSRRSASVDLRRRVDAVGQDATSPLGSLSGIITPADLHFSRHHFGVPELDVANYELLVHGMVERPTIFTLDDLRRLPSRSCICFLECAGNGAGAFRRPRPEMSAQAVDGTTSTSEWVGVPLAAVLAEVGVTPQAAWLLAESQDAGLYARSIPLGKAYDDALLAYAQNGEPLRVEQGFPLRLVLPGWEGSASVKWLRRIELMAGPAMTRDETARYTDVSRDGMLHPFVFVMDVKSIITDPSYPQVIAPGWREIRGLTWSGRGRISRVDVTGDGGATWTPAVLDEPVIPKAHTRFRLAWRWDGGATVLMSRAVDETGATQPTLDEFRAARTSANDYRNNYVRAWRVTPGGQVFFASGC
jgi:sulfane dehydrogenase subunit SoxC